MSRSGFRLVELLIVLAIVGILIGMLLPATRSVREAARRTHCLNNLRQVALGTLNYESQNMQFPRATGLPDHQGVGAADQYSPLVAILPYSESGTLYSAIVNGDPLDGINIEPCPSLSADIPHWRIPIPFYQCPSTLGPAGVQPSSYGFCIGDRARNIANPESFRGGFANGEPLGFGHLTDGSSNTILVGEIRAADNSYAIDQPEALLQAPSKCFDLTDKTRHGWDFKKEVLLSPIERGGHWADGRAGVALFNTILPPKSPSATVGGSIGADGIYSANGSHPGGLNIALFDGSTHSISDNVDAGDSSHPAPTVEQMSASEPSPYGAWGALGTINDGEVVDATDF